MYLADNLQYLRNRRQLSQLKMGQLVHLSRNQLASYEDARAQPSLDKLIRISDFFQVSLDHLVKTKINQYNYNEVLKNSTAQK